MAAHPTRPAVALTLVAAVWLVTLAAAVVGIVLFVGRAGPNPELWEFVAEETVWAACFLVIGALVVARTPRSALGWLMLVIALAAASAVWVVGMLRSDLAPRLNTTVHWITLVNITCYDTAMLLVVLLFPDGRLLAPRWRWMAVAVVGTGLLRALAVLLRSPDLYGYRGVPSPLYTPETAGLGVALDQFSYAARLLCWVVCLWLLARRGRGLDPVVRRQIALVLPVIFLSMAVELINQLFSGSSFLWVGVTVPRTVYLVLRIVVALLVPLSIGYVIVRNRLYLLERAVRASAAVVAVGAVLGVTYVLAAAALSVLLSGTLAVGVLTGVAGAGLVPLIGWTRGRVDRVFYGEQAEPMRAMRTLSNRLAERIDPAEIPLVVCQNLVSLFGFGGAMLESGGRVLGAAGDTTTGLPERFDHGLLVWPRSGRSRLNANEVAAMRSLADQLGPALGVSVPLQRDQASSHDAHQRLRRDLHDSLGPTLAAIVLQLGAAKALVPARSPAGTVLDTCVDHLREVIDEIRRLARDQQPLALRELGLPDALHELAARLSTPDTPVSVELRPGLPTLPVAVRRAVYLIAAEAVTNAVRHAAANRITVSLRREDGVVRLEVSDDGTGFADSEAVGVGLASMRHRADELGGQWQLASRSDGTTISVVLPLS